MFMTRHVLVRNFGSITPLFSTHTPENCAIGEQRGYAAKTTQEHMPLSQTRAMSFTLRLSNKGTISAQHTSHASHVRCVGPKWVTSRFHLLTLR
jgi:CxxC motif-containing protein (DUF1111 family)